MHVLTKCVINIFAQPRSISMAISLAQLLNLNLTNYKTNVPPSTYRGSQSRNIDAVYHHCELSNLMPLSTMLGDFTELLST